MSADHGALETIMFRDGYLTEASASNVWVVHEGAVLEPAKSEHVLEGIRYDLIRELCEGKGIATTTCAPSPRAGAGDRRAAAQLGHQEVLPVTTLDGQPVGHGAARQAGAGVRASSRPTSAPGLAIDLIHDRAMRDIPPGNR